MDKLSYSIKEEYTVELNIIINRLEQLKNGKVYELTKIKSDGSLYTNTEKLQNDIYDLIYKIQTGKRGMIHKMREAIRKIDD